MSYRLDLSFKNCKPQDVYKNICEFEDLLVKNAEQYIKDNLIFIRIDKEKDRLYNIEQVDKFISTLFKYHMWYCEEISALCIVGGSNIKEIDSWFDGYVFFQDSCDQDYEYETWDFNKSLRRIKNRIKKMKTNRFVKEYIQNSDYYDEDDKERLLKDVDYHKKTYIYGIIEKIIDPIWTSGLDVTPINGALNENMFELRRKAIRLLLAQDPKLEDCFNIVEDLFKEDK